jgi:enoyl-CoA hydratase/carnithine racemase
MLEIINHDKVREIRLTRPPVNALNLELVKLLTQSLREAETECGAVVLSGRDGVFSAGLDVVELLRCDYDGMTDFWNAFFELLELVACSQIPVAAAITGHSPAGGAIICLMCDYRVMSRGGYKIGLNETRVGLIIPPVLQNSMARLVGPRMAEQMIVAGTMIDPSNAFKTGLVDALETGYEATIQHAIGWCEDLLSLPQHSMLGNRAVARAHFKQEFARHTADSVALFVDNWFSDEAQAIMKALVAQLKSKNN